MVRKVENLPKEGTQNLILSVSGLGSTQPLWRALQVLCMIFIFFSLWLPHVIFATEAETRAQSVWSPLLGPHPLGEVSGSTGSGAAETAALACCHPAAVSVTPSNFFLKQTENPGCSAWCFSGHVLVTHGSGVSSSQRRSDSGCSAPRCLGRAGALLVGLTECRERGEPPGASHDRRGRLHRAVAESKAAGNLKLLLCRPLPLLGVLLLCPFAWG